MCYCYDYVRNFVANYSAALSVVLDVPATVVTSPQVRKKLPTHRGLISNARIETIGLGLGPELAGREIATCLPM